MDRPRFADLISIARPLVIALLPACTQFPPPLTPDQAIGLVEQRATLVQTACDRLIKDPGATFSRFSHLLPGAPEEKLSVSKAGESCTWTSDHNVNDNPAIHGETPSISYRMTDGHYFSVGDMRRVVEGGGGSVFEVSTYESHPSSASTEPTEKSSDPLKNNKSASIFSQWDYRTSSPMCEVLTTKEASIFTDGTYVHDNTLCTRATQAVRTAIRYVEDRLLERERAQKAAPTPTASGFRSAH